MKRRAFLAAAALAPVFRASAQGKLPRIALVDPTAQAANMVEGHAPWGALLSELRRLGYVEGQTIAIDRWSGGGASSSAVYRELARKLIAPKPALIVVQGQSVLLQLAAETRVIPIVASASLSPELRKAGNITGVNSAFDAQQLYGKQVEVLANILKPGARVAWLGPKLVWEGAPGEAARKGAESARVSLHPVLVATPVSKTTIRSAFQQIAQARLDGVLVSTGVLFPFRESVAEQAVAMRLPALGGGRGWAEAGLALGYGVDTESSFRRLAHFADKLLKGAKPADLPIENPTKVELVVNLETARWLKIAVPQAMLLRADRVIE